MSLGISAAAWAGIGAVGSIAAGVYGASQSGKAADTQAASADKATQTQWDMYQQTRADQAPYLQTGYKALNTLTGKTGSDSLGGFTTSPGYNFVRNEGQRGIERSAAARGGAFSGPALRALDTYNSGLASQEYGNWWNRMAGLAGVGQTSTNTLGALGTNYAGNIGNTTMAAGNARASGIIGGANSIMGGLNTGINNYLFYQGGGFNGYGGGSGYTPYVAPNLNYINTSYKPGW